MQSERVLFNLTVEWRPQAPVTWQATLEDQQGLCIGRFETPLALLEWLEEFIYVRSTWPLDLP